MIRVATHHTDAWAVVKHYAQNTNGIEGLTIHLSDIIEDEDI